MDFSISSYLHHIIYLFTGILAMGITVFIADRLTSFNTVNEIQQGNKAVAILTGAIIIAVSILVGGIVG